MGVEEKSNREEEEEEEERKGKKAHARVVIISFLIPMSSCPRLLLSTSSSGLVQTQERNPFCLDPYL
jgi:hypothetical protein